MREFNYEKQNYQLYHVIFYRVEGEINYQIDTHLIELLMEVPQAPLQMPEDKIYSFKIEGKAYQLAQQELEVPFKGKLFLKIKGLSNFLSHLHHIGVVSAIEQNLASMMIGASSKEPISAFEKKNDVTLTIKLQPDSVCIGPLKVYP